MSLIWAFVLANVGRILMVGSIVAAVGGGFLYMKTHYYNQGYAAAINAVAADNKEAVSAANKQRQKVRDCVAGGGEWDSTRGVCTQP